MEVRESGNSLVRMSALGVDGGVIASSLSLRETDPPFLVYKTKVISILQRLFILIGCFR